MNNPIIPNWKKLKKMVSFRTISSDASQTPEMWKCASYIQNLLEAFQVETKILKSKYPIVLGKLLNDSSYPTILLYGHYDVVQVSGKWESDPWTLVGKEGFFLGRGTADNKGPILDIIFSVKEYIMKRSHLNFVFIFDGEEELGFTPSFERNISANKSFLGNPDYAVICNSSFFKGVPSLVYGMRGVIDIEIEVRTNQNHHSENEKRSVHSQNAGAFVPPLHELIVLLTSLIDENAHLVFEKLEEGFFFFFFALI